MWKLCGFLGLFADFRWSVDTWLGMCVLEAQDGAVVGVFWPLPSKTFSSPYYDT